MVYTKLVQRFWSQDVMLCLVVRVATLTDVVQISLKELQAGPELVSYPPVSRTHVDRPIKRESLSITTPRCWIGKFAVTAVSFFRVYFINLLYLLYSVYYNIQWRFGSICYSVVEKLPLAIWTDYKLFSV